MAEELIEHGILTEQSDRRVHVSAKTRHLFIFPTESGRKVVRELQAKQVLPKMAYQINVDGATAVGYPVAWRRIEGIESYPLPPWIQCDESLSLGKLGEQAEAIFLRMVEARLLPIRGPLRRASLDEQRKGCDFIDADRLRYECKWNGIAGMKERGGSGNIFLQLSESNPQHVVSGSSSGTAPADGRPRCPNCKHELYPPWHDHDKGLFKLICTNCGRYWK